MYYVLFEGVVKADKLSLTGHYHEFLVPKLHKIPGFLQEQPFGSPFQDNKGLNLTTWEDAEAVKRWRNQSDHLGLQAKGSDTVYEAYRLRLGRGYEKADTSSLSNAREFVVLYSRDDVSETPDDDVTTLLPADSRHKFQELLANLNDDSLNALATEFYANTNISVSELRALHRRAESANMRTLERSQAYLSLVSKISLNKLPLRSIASEIES